MTGLGIIGKIRSKIGEYGQKKGGDVWQVAKIPEVCQKRATALLVIKQQNILCNQIKSKLV